jgi:hypothetical protein
MEFSVRIESWPLAGALTISGSSQTEAVVVVAELTDGNRRGRGESVLYARYGETSDGIVAAIDTFRPALQRGLDRAALQHATPPGAARNALDCAYWDVNALQPAAGCANWPDWPRRNQGSRPIRSLVDLGGPLLLAKDRDRRLRYDGSLVYPPAAALWG